MPTDIPAKRALLDALIGGELDSHVTARRDAGDTWQQIATDLSERTNVAVSREALARWFDRRPAKEAA